MFRRRDDHPSGSNGDAASLFARPVRNSIRAPGLYTRQQHIDSYLKNSQLSPSTRKVSEDDSTYDTVFQSVAGDTLILRVHWPPQHSQQQQRPPAMTLAGVEARHAWLDGRMRITGYAPIQNETAWRDAQQLLGTAVLNVITHLQLQPPSIVRFVDSGLIAIQQKSSTNNTATTTSNNHQQKNNNKKANNTIPEQAVSRRRRGGAQAHNHDDAPPPAYDAMQLSTAAPPPPTLPKLDLPTIPKEFPQLKDLSREQLEELNTDELALAAFCNRHLPLLKQYHDIQSNTLLAKNAETARTNLESQDKLDALHKSVVDKQAQLAEKVAQFQKLEKTQDAICRPPDTRKVCRDLTKAKRQAFDESERIADDWVCGDGSVEDFCRNFLERRKVHHERAAKLELLEQQRNSNTTR